VVFLKFQGSIDELFLWLEEEIHPVIGCGCFGSPGILSARGKPEAGFLIGEGPGGKRGGVGSLWIKSKGE
jgi:hypothetical protein